MRVYFTGQRNFANRGCEALVRSTCQLLNEIAPGAEILVPSDLPAFDRQQWPEHEAAGVRFVPTYPRPLRQRAWSALLSRPWPGISALATRLPLARRQRAEIESADRVLSLGGDMYSLDYGPPVRVAAMDAAALRAGIPTLLWGASVGPFAAHPPLERALLAHLRRFTGVVVREKISRDYLAAAGVKNLTLATDPAFHLSPQAVAAPRLEQARAAGKEILGLNLSPIAHQVATRHGLDFYREMAQFVRWRVRNDGQFVVLIPHVMARPGSHAVDDYQVLQTLEACLDPAVRDAVWLAPATWNAAQYKGLIGQCQWFSGARTHTTIAALSQGVPTLSLSYSIKATGINELLLGSRQFVLPLAVATADKLDDGCRVLRAQGRALATHLHAALAPAQQASRAALAQWWAR